MSRRRRRVPPPSPPSSGDDSTAYFPRDDPPRRSLFSRLWARFVRFWRRVFVKAQCSEPLILTPVHNLPNEVLERIFQLLTKAGDVLAAEETCLRWRCVIRRSKMIWFNVTRDIPLEITHFLEFRLGQELTTWRELKDVKHLRALIKFILQHPKDSRVAILREWDKLDSRSRDRFEALHDSFSDLAS